MQDRPTTSSVKSSGTLGLAGLLEAGLPLLRNIALVHLMAPEQVGLVFSLVVVITAIELVTDLGVAVYLVRGPSSAQRMPTLQALALIRSLCVGGVIVMLAPVVAHVFHAPQDSAAYAWLGAIALLRGFENLGVKEATRDYVFWREATVVAAANSVAVVVTIVVGYLTASFTCLLWGMFAGSATSVCLSHILSPRPYRVGWNTAVAKDALAFGLPLLGHGVAVTLSLSDRVIVGALLGPTALAIYSISYNTAMLPRGILEKFLTAVFVPVFYHSRARDKSVSLFAAWAFLLAALGTAFGAGLCVLGQEAIGLVFGNRYVTSRLFMCLAGFSFYLKMLLLLPMPEAYRSGGTSLVMVGSLLSAAAILPGAVMLSVFGTLEAFLVAMTLAEFTGMILFHRRASLVQGWPLSLSLYLLVIPALVFWLCCLAAVVAPTMSLLNWMALCGLLFGSLAMFLWWVARKMQMDVRLLAG